MADIPDDLITAAEAVQAFNVKLDTLYSWVHRGAVRAWKRAGRLYLSRSELEDMYVPVPVPAGIVPRAERAAERRARQKRTRDILKRFGMHVNGLG